MSPRSAEHDRVHAGNRHHQLGPSNACLHLPMYMVPWCVQLLTQHCSPLPPQTPQCPFQVDLVGCRLMSSLMGEWGMMQQLQGLINVFLIASPAIVEWADATFDALEAAPANKVVKDTAGSGSTPPAVSRTMSRINPGSPAVTAAAASSQSGARGVSGGVLSVVCGEPAVGVDDLDFMALEDRLQVGVGMC